MHISSMQNNNLPLINNLTSDSSFSNHTLPSTTTMATAQKSPLSYSGTKEEDLNLYIEELQQYCTIHALNARQAAYMLRMTLKESAKTFIRTIPDTTPFSDLFTQICQRFQTSERQIYYFRILQKRCQDYLGENILNFLDELRLIALKGSISEDFVVSLVLSSLSNDWES
jgi:hypothetical protein